MKSRPPVFNRKAHSWMKIYNHLPDRVRIEMGKEGAQTNSLRRQWELLLLGKPLRVRKEVTKR